MAQRPNTLAIVLQGEMTQVKMHAAVLIQSALWLNTPLDMRPGHGLSNCCCMLSIDGEIENKGEILALEHSSGSRTPHTRRSLKQVPLVNLVTWPCNQCMQENPKVPPHTHPEPHEVHPQAACTSIAAAGRSGAQPEAVPT